jgi:putative membrane protein
MKTRLVMGIGMILALGVVLAWGCSEQGKKIEGKAAGVSSPSSFAADAARGGMMEVELGRLAMSNASDSRVKAFGQRMMTDHTMINNDLAAAAKGANVTLPNSMSQSQQQRVQQLAALKGPAFDRAYMNEMVMDHQKDVAAFDQAAKSQPEPFKSFAAKQLPILRDHLKGAQDIQASLAAGATTPK